MKNILVFILSVLFIISGCSCPGGTDDARLVAKVNKYEMRAEDLRYELENLPYDDQGLLDTEEGKEVFLDRLIEKEILLQEAQGLGLDKEKDFMRSIESYWEQALLRILLEKKSKEISSMVHVYDNEVREYYKESGETLPFSKVKSEIKRDIQRNKETKAMNVWIEELRKKAYIKVNKDVLEEVVSNR